MARQIFFFFWPAPKKVCPSLVYTIRILERDTSVVTTTKILAGRQRNVTISHGGKWIFFSPKRPDQPRNQANYLFNRQGKLFPWVKVANSWSWPLTSV